MKINYNKPRENRVFAGAEAGEAVQRILAGGGFDILMPGSGFRLTGCTRDGADIRRTGREVAEFGGVPFHPDCQEQRATRGEIDENLPRKPFFWISPKQPLRARDMVHRHPRGQAFFPVA